MTQKYRDSLPLTPCGTASGVMHIACAIAGAFHKSRPTVAKLRSHFGMSRATAYRWVRAWCDANGVQS